MKEQYPFACSKLISIIKLASKKKKKWGGGLVVVVNVGGRGEGQQRAGVEGVNEVETLIGRGVTPSRPLTGTRLIHLNGHWRPTQTQTISSAG